MERTGLHVYHRWNAGEFVSHLSMHGFWVVEHALLGGRVLPLCYAACRWTPAERISEQNAVTIFGDVPSKRKKAKMNT